MSLPIGFASETWHVVRPILAVDHGTEVAVWTSAPETPVAGCVSWPGPSSDTTDRRDGAQIAHTVVLPPGTDIRRTDGVRDPDGELWSIEGRPQRWRSPTGHLDCTAVELIQWEG